MDDDDADDAGGTYKLMTSSVLKDCGNLLSIFNRVVSDSPFISEGYCVIAQFKSELWDICVRLLSREIVVTSRVLPEVHIQTRGAITREFCLYIIQNLLLGKAEPHPNKNKQAVKGTVSYTDPPKYNHPKSQLKVNTNQIKMCILQTIKKDQVLCPPHLDEACPTPDFVYPTLSCTLHDSKHRYHNGVIDLYPRISCDTMRREVTQRKNYRMETT
nr:uncharacterized protein LOC129447470 [Misgurnus anguillicaudatus]